MNTTQLTLDEAAVPAGESPLWREPAIACAVLLPHAPILVPEVGGARGEAAHASSRAMRAAAARVLHQAPQAIVLISPHAPRQPGAFGIWADDPVRGSLGQFNALHAEVSLPNDPALAKAIAREAHARGLTTWSIRHHLLDHGAVVPLWFLHEAGWKGPTVILSLNHPHEPGLAELGQAIAAAAQRLQLRVAVVASGDMSHRLKAGAPCGFHPAARQFDEMFIELLRAGTYHEIENLDADLRSLAAEDAADSTVIAAAAVDWQSDGHEVLNYEGPFGVGYGVAVLYEAAGPDSRGRGRLTDATVRDGEVLPDIARQAVASALADDAGQPPMASGDYLSAKRGVFVTVRNENGGLRGCVGTYVPMCENTVAETWRSAQLAALKDPRFSPVQACELSHLRFEVSVLHGLEQIPTAAELDPLLYGVLVSTTDGRRGLLLPCVKGIRTAAQQLNLACEKGWIDVREPMTICRFEVDHFAEAGSVNT